MINTNAKLLFKNTLATVKWEFLLSNARLEKSKSQEIRAGRTSEGKLIQPSTQGGIIPINLSPPSVCLIQGQIWPMGLPKDPEILAVGGGSGTTGGTTPLSNFQTCGETTKSRDVAQC